MNLPKILNLTSDQEELLSSILPGGDNWTDLIRNKGNCLKSCPYFKSCRSYGPDKLCSSDWRNSEFNFDVSNVLFHVLNNFDYYNQQDLTDVSNKSEIVAALRQAVLNAQRTYFLDSFAEGSPRLVRHLMRERDQDLSRKVKDAAISKGSLQCSACLTDFLSIYGETAARRIIECHHNVPISSPEHGGKTKIQDLILLCANCHRLAHSSPDPHKPYMPEEIQRLFLHGR